jgi:ubiquinone biosynthesis protein UbiJ
MSFHFVAEKLFWLIQKGLTQLDPAIFTPLAQHQGKTVCIHLTHFPPLYFEIEPQQLRLCEKAPSHIDVTFEGNLSAFLELLFNKKAHTKGLHIRGDMDCAKAFYDAWTYSDFDFENQLAKIVGDTLAHSLCQSFKQGQSFLSKTFENRKHDLAFYFQNENGLLISLHEVEEFYHHVAHLRDDVERLSARINLLKFQIEKR